MTTDSILAICQCENDKKKSGRYLDGFCSTLGFAENMFAVTPAVVRLVFSRCGIRCIYLVHTYAEFTSTISFLRGTKCFSYDVYVLCFCLPREAFFHSRGIEACPVTTDGIFGDE